MEMSGERRIGAPRDKVWEALNDPEVLKQCIPGCEEIEKSGDNAFAAKVKAKVGPVSARFSGQVTLTNLNPPESYTIEGEGTGGAAGFAKGKADVKLDDQGEETLLRYGVEATVGGKLAQLGQRLVQGTAEKYANQFFQTFTEVVGKPAEAAPAEAAAPSAPEEKPAEAPAPAEERPAAAAEAGGRERAEAEARGEAVEAGVRAASLGHAAPEGPTGEPGRPAAGGGEERRGGLSPMIWVGGVIVIVVILLAVFSL